MGLLRRTPAGARGPPLIPSLNGTRSVREITYVPETVHRDAARSGVHRRNTALRGGGTPPPPVGSTRRKPFIDFPTRPRGHARPLIGRNETLSLLLQNHTLRSFRKFALGVRRQVASGETRAFRHGGGPPNGPCEPSAEGGDEVLPSGKHQGEAPWRSHLGVHIPTRGRSGAGAPFSTPTRPFARSFRAPSGRRGPVRLRRSLLPPGYECLG